MNGKNTLQKVELVELEDSSHIFSTDQPEKSVEMILNFLKDTKQI